MSLITLAQLLISETRQQIYDRGLAVARSLSIPVDSWIVGDPTRSLYWFLATQFQTLEIQVVGFISSGFLDKASGDWLTVLAHEVYNVDRVEATFATTVVHLANNGGGLYVIEPGDVVVKSSSSGKTYTNVDGGTLASGPGTTLDLTFSADEAGSASSAGATEIDAIVTGLLGVTCSNPSAAFGADAELDDSVKDRCRAKFATLSPNGPRDAYDFVVRDSALTGTTEITRSRTIADSTTGDVTVYVAGSSGAVSGAAITAAQSAVEKNCAPLCITPTVANCTSTTIAVTYELWLYAAVGDDVATIKDNVQAALEAMFAARPIGGDIIAPATTGSLYVSLVMGTIRDVYPAETFRVAVTAPSGDTSLAINAVPQLGLVTGTVHVEANP